MKKVTVNPADQDLPQKAKELARKQVKGLRQTEEDNRSEYQRFSTLSPLKEVRS